MFLGLWHPNIGALTSTASGILHFPFRQFALRALVIAFFWNILWGTLAFFLGEAALGILGVRFALIVILIWIAIRLFIKHKDEVQKSDSPLPPA